MIYDVMNYGAVGDGVTNDGAAIQKAIDECSANGGGRVLVPGGRVFRSGVLILRSYVELHLEMGAVIKGSDKLEDYSLSGAQTAVPEKLDVPTYENCEYAGKPTLFFIYAKDCEYVSITGFGKIDGNEEIFHGHVTPWHIDGFFYPRVPLMFIENVRHLSLQQITCANSAFWTVHLVGCEDVLIDSIRILNSLRMANCDGIDPDHCKNVRIANCHIETADDCIVFKNSESTMEYGSCENICVTNCTLISTSAAIKFGSESEDLFRNITIQNCNISRTNRGISLQLRDKGRIENVTFSGLNIETRMFSKEHYWGKAEPIAITAVKRKEETNIGYVKNVRFQNINCSGENGIMIYGDDSCNIGNITFENVHLDLVKKTDWPKDSCDIRPTIGDGILKQPHCALYARNAEDISFNNFTYHVDANFEDQIPTPVNIDRCSGFVINGQKQ